MGLPFRELRRTGPVNEQVRDEPDLSASFLQAVESAPTSSAPFQLTHLAEVHDHECVPLDEESER